MKGIRFERVYKSFHDEPILQNLNLNIPSGTFFAILGPSGSGKTTLLRLIAGFEQPDSGRIFVGDEDVTDAPSHLRSVNTVFQNYALFPHMNVFDNVAYALMLRGVHHDIIKEKVIMTLEKVHLSRYAYKAINQLSGGQQQRVALARAIINQPDVLLLDEPLAALDLKLREKMLIELVELQDELRTTFVYVTHDQLEALTVADYMAIMNADGEIEQVGTPKEIYEFPDTVFVAQFVGTTNILNGTLVGHDNNHVFLAVQELGTFTVTLPKDARWVVDGALVVMSIRPEKIELSLKRLEAYVNCIQGIIEAIIYHGRSTQYNVRVLPDLVIRVFLQNEEHSARDVVTYDDTVYVHWHADSVVLFKE
jgi:spermidine/putrescine transport system ATP-binding protein